VEGTHAGAVCKDLQPVGMTHAGAVHEGCLLREGPHAGPGEECEEEGAAEATCDELTTTPIPHPPVPLEGRRYRKLRVKVSHGRREGWGKGVLRFGFASHYATLI